MVVRPPKHTRRKNAFYFSALGLKLADLRFHLVIPLGMVPSTHHPVFWGEYNPIFAARHRAKQWNFIDLGWKGLARTLQLARSDHRSLLTVNSRLANFHC